MTQFRRNSIHVGYQKVQVTDDVKFKLKNIYLHSSNSSSVLTDNSTRIFQILVNENADTVSVRLILYVLTNVYDFLQESVDDAMIFGVLREIKLLPSDNMHVAEFSRFLDLVGVARTRLKHEARLEAAWSKLFVLVLIVSTIGLVVSCAMYFSSPTPSFNIFCAMLTFGILFLIGSFFLLVLPLIKAFIIHRDTVNTRAEQSTVMTGRPSRLALTAPPYKQFVLHAFILAMSLLVSTGIPSNPGLLANWAERIRDRVSSISQTILRLEEEQQNLLSMLSEAGMHQEIETDVIDLLDDSASIADTLIAEQVDDQPILENIVADHDMLDPELEGINPADLTYILPEDENQVPNIPSRIFLLSEFHLIDWERVSLAEIKEWAVFFGMKPAQGRKFLVSELCRFFEIVSVSFAPHREESNATSLTDMFIEAIKSEPSIYERILLYETIELSEIYDLLKKKNSISFSQKCVKDFLTTQQLHSSNTHKIPKQEKPEEVVKTRRELRKSITCP